MTELELIARLRRHLPAGSPVGDDCAVIPHGDDEDLLFTTDFLIEDVHFRRRGRSAADIGYRALARSLSDIAAMGGTPRWAMLALALPPWATPKWIGGFYSGFLSLAKTHGTELIGGDLSHLDRLVADVMVCGTVPRGQALRRSGARPGDGVFVSGPLGKSRWRFEPRLRLGRDLRTRGATACMDVSDGLSIDLHRLCLESKVSADLDSFRKSWDRGEDYELLFTAPTDVRLPRGMIRIGRIIEGEPGRVTCRGRVIPPLGYDHFRGPQT